VVRGGTGPITDERKCRMITVRFNSHNIPDLGPSRFVESFHTAQDALAYLNGYLGAGDIVVKDFDIQGLDTEV
jgi:hypothetical protein